MLTIVNGSLEKVKAELKQQAKWKADEIKDSKKKIKSWKDAEKKAAKEEERKENPFPKELDEKLKTLELMKEKYSSGAVPVRVGDIVINFAVYQKAIPKLKGCKIYPEEIHGNEMIIIYSDKEAKGKIHLYDISKIYSEIHHIPVAEISLDGQEA